MGILEGVKCQTLRAAYNGPKQQWPLRGFNFFLEPDYRNKQLDGNCFGDR